MRVLFMGTPAIAAKTLRYIHEAGHEICGVVTQPDKSKNRGMKAAYSEVKEAALSLGLSVYQPETLRDGAFAPTLEELHPDIILLVAYGKILPSYILEYPRYGCVNLHASLLPTWRGAAPIQRAIMSGAEKTGVTVMYMEKGLDTGDMILSEEVEIREDDTTLTLTERLGDVGAPLLLEAVDAIGQGTVNPIKQDDSLATYASMMSKEDGILCWKKTAGEISAQIRGCDPWPGAEILLDEIKVKVFSPRVLKETKPEEIPGTVCTAGKKGLVVVCGEGTLLSIGELQPSGKKKMPASAYFNGHPLKEYRIK